MFSTKFSGNSSFNTGFAQDKSSMDTEFGGNQVLKGEDGFSPEVEMTEIDNGYRLTITDKDSTQSIDIKNGKDGRDGVDGIDGKDGKDGINGGEAEALFAG